MTPEIPGPWYSRLFPGYQTASLASCLLGGESVQECAAGPLSGFSVLGISSKPSVYFLMSFCSASNQLLQDPDVWPRDPSSQ